MTARQRCELNAIAKQAERHHRRLVAIEDRLHNGSPEKAQLGVAISGLLTILSRMRAL